MAAETVRTRFFMGGVPSADCSAAHSSPHLACARALLRLRPSCRGRGRGQSSLLFLPLDSLLGVPRVPISPVGEASEFRHHSLQPVLRADATRAITVID